jgi:hypothetical protein
MNGDKFKCFIQRRTNGVIPLQEVLLLNISSKIRTRAPHKNGVYMVSILNPLKDKLQKEIIEKLFDICHCHYSCLR